VISPEQLREQLASPDEEVRHAAIQGLHLAGSALLPVVIGALGDASWRVRKAALDLVLQAPAANSLPLLIAGLRDEGNAGRRNSSMEALVRLGPAAVPPLAPLVADPDPDLRKFVVDALGNIDAPAVPALLRAALEDSEENVAAAAAEFLGRRRDATAVPQLLRRLGESGSWLTFSCLRALGEIGDAAAAPAVSALLGEPGLRQAALEALGRVGDAQAVPHVLDALFSRDRGLRRVAALAAHRILPRLGPGAAAALAAGVRAQADDEFFDFLRGLLAQEDPQVLAAAATLLGFAPGTLMVSILLDALPQAAEQDQELFAAVLAGLPDTDLPLLAARLLDPSPVVRLRLAEVLGRRGCREAVPLLLTLLEDGIGHVRAAGAAALGRIGDPAAVPPLVGLLRDPFPDVREAGMEAIVAIGKTGSSRLGLVLALLEPHFSAPDEGFAAAAVRIAGRLGGPGLIARLGLALRDARGEVRRAAVEAVGAVGGAEAVAALRVALTDEDVAVRREAVHRLGATREATALPLLLPMLGDEDLWVRVRSVQALGGIAHPDAWRVLLAAAADDPPGPRRLAAVRALGAGKVPGSLPVLTDLAGAADRETGMAAIEALGALGDPGALDVLLLRLADPAWGLRAVAVRALGPFAAEPRVRPALVRAAAEDADPLVRSLAGRIVAAAADPAAPAPDRGSGRGRAP
jgi:HEAT repeat protein